MMTDPSSQSSLDAISGLSQAEAARRLAIEGGNELPTADRLTALLRHLAVVREPMFLLLLGAGLLYALIGEPTDALVLAAFATLSISIAVVQRGRSDRVLASLRDLSSPRALVVREGVRLRIASREIVRGDVLLINEGDRLPADAILRDGEEVLVDESLLTGESVPVRKLPAPGVEVAPASPGGDDHPHLYSGTLVVRGHGLAVTTATGARSAVGRIG
ncbi:MAG: ATPase, partial [Rhizobiaceae bacterium]